VIQRYPRKSENPVPSIANQKKFLKVPGLIKEPESVDPHTKGKFRGKEKELILIGGREGGGGARVWDEKRILSCS